MSNKDKLKSQESILLGQHIDADEEKLHLIEGGIEQVNEEVVELVEEGKIEVTAQDKSLNKKVIARISTAIESSFTQEELVDACHKTFEVIVQMANTVQSSAINKALKTTGVSIRQKIKEFSSGSEDPKIEAQNIFDQTISQFIRCFSAIELASESGQIKLSFSGALALYSFASSFLAKDEKFSLAYSEDLVRCQVALTPSLSVNQSVFAHATHGIYTLISKTFQGYNSDLFISGILTGLASPVRFTYLNYVYQESNDVNGLKSIGEKFNSLVMNDKEKQNFININFFLPYLTKVNEAIFRDVLFPEIDFMMKRGLSMVTLIGKTVKALTFKFNADLVGLLTSELFTDEYLVKEESIPEIKAYFSILGSKLESKESGVALAVDFLFKRYQASKSSSSINIVQRLAFVRYLSASLKSFKSKDLIAEDHIKSIITAVLEHVFQIKEESAVKDTYSDLEQLLEKASSLSFIAEPLKKLITKPLNIWHINLFTDLLDAKAKDLGEVISVVAPQFKQMLSSENFKTTANFSTIIALTGFFCSAFTYTSDPSYLAWMIQNEGILGYFATKKGYVNTQGYFLKSPTQHDVKNHIKAITHFTQSHYNESPLPTGDAQLRDTLCHYILNEQYTFREHEIIECIQQISKSAGEKFVGNFVKSLFNKVKEFAQIPPSYSREESAQKTSQSIPNKIKLALKYSLQEKKSDLTSDEFVSLVKLISHPWVSSTNQSLLTQIRNLEELFPEGKLSNYFASTQTELVDYAIRSRSGILSPDPVLRALAINIGVALSSQKLITAFLDDIATIMNYKPLELAQKLEKIFLEEYERISFYDLMMYSEVSKDLLLVFKDRDLAVVKRELAVQQDGAEASGAAGQAEQAGQEEEKEEAAPVDPAKLTAMLLKQAAAKKKAEAAKKPAGKTAAPVKAAAPAKKPQAKEEVPVHQPLDKEKRRQQDRDQIVNYLQEIQRIKGQQVTAALDIIKRSNQNNLQLDLTLNHLLMPLIKLLNYSATRFSTNICLHTLFEAHKLEPLFLVKNEIVSCLNAMSAQRIYIKHMREFQVIFQHAQNRTQVSLFDKGYIQLIMMMANYVLKDLSVHLSVKEQALAVVQDILEDSNLVENIDLVIVTINMMKSSYNNENLAQYLNILLKRLTLEQLALILQRIFEYEPVPRMILLRELLEYELPLCCPVWFSTQIWILQFDEECGKLARKLWNKYGMVLRSGTLDLAQEGKASNMFFYLRSKNTNIFDNTIRGIVCAIEIFQNRYDLIVDDLIEFYNKEMKIIETESLKASDAESGQTHAQNTVVVADERLNRMAVAEIIKRTAHMVGTNSFKKVFEFFITQGCLDQNEHVSKACMEASIQIITTKGPDYSDELLKILEKYINEKQKYSEVSKNQAIIMIGALANFLDNTAQQRLLGTFEKMLELLNSPSELIRQSICRVIPQLSRFFIDKSKKFLEDHLNILRTSSDDKTIRGSAYAVSGIIKGLGLQNFIQMDLLNTIQKECFTKHADPMRKISGLYLYETLTISLGKVFEMYVEKILPNIIMCISDPKDQVRKCATQANRTVMSRLSNHAIKQVLPIFLKGLENDNWRSKLASVEALGNMAFCAPRQISGFLPHIVKGIREVLSDTHEKVHEAALQAIQNIGSVIKCPEIADILPTLVKALSNPNQFLKSAMKVLLDTSFVHAIDAPSLSLLIPILDSGLMMHDNESKHLASKLMGNICNLTQDPEDLLPYIKILMPAIKNSLFDSIPEIRASAAKALGSLSKGLGLENSSEMLTWLHSVLHQKQLHSSERSGAAQAFAEIISVHGVKFYEETIKLIVIKSQEPQSHIRESYRSVMVFLATCYDHFVKYLPKLLPLMIQGLSDDVEEVRKISLRNVKICIKLFGRQAPNQLVDPIMQMMFHRDFRVRQSSSVLMYQLVKELENDIIKSVPKYVSIETKNEILSSMFILKYDIIERVATQASQIWKNIIENQLKVLKSIINVLIKQIFDLIQNENMELQEMGLNCLRGICEKFGEKFVGDTIDILESYMERATSLQQTIAVTKGIYNMAFAAPIKLITDLRLRFLAVTEVNISSESEEIRSLAAKIICIVLQKTFEPMFMTQTLEKHFLKKLHGLLSVDQASKEADLILLTFKETLKEQAPELKLEDKIIRLCNQAEQQGQKLSIAQARLLAAVASKIGANMFKKKNCTTILNKLMTELSIDELVADDEKRIQEVLITFSEVISNALDTEVVTVNEQVIAEFYGQCEKRDRPGFYVDFITYYCTHAKVNYEKFAKMYMENVLALMNSQDDKLVDKVVKGFSAIINGLQKENQFTMIPLIKELIENIGVERIRVGSLSMEERPLYKKRVASIKMLEKTEGVKSLSAVIQNSITHGSIECRIDSAICFQYLLDFSSPAAIKMEVIKICGALIRVVNDKFPPALKLQIFHALKLILLRASANAKAMAPQLQTTFLKAFNDSQASEAVRKEVVGCLIEFMKIALKVDPIVKELTTMIEGDKLDQIAKIEASEILALILRNNGKTIQQSMSAQIQTSLMSILQSKPGMYNDKTLANCAVALAFLAAYASDPLQQVTLFDAFDSTLVLPVSFGVKFGVLCNGASSALWEKLIPNLEAHLKDMLKDMTGIEEVDEKYSEDGSEEEGGRLHGALEIIGHISDIFVRRYTQPTDPLYSLQFKVINESGLFEKLNAQSGVSRQTVEQVLFYLQSIPVKTANPDTLDAELANVIGNGMTFINQFYLEFSSKKVTTPAVLNLAQSNFDGWLNVNDDAKLHNVTVASVKQVVNKESYKAVLPENVRMLTVELAFI